MTNNIDIETKIKIVEDLKKTEGLFRENGNKYFKIIDIHKIIKNFSVLYLFIEDLKNKKLIDYNQIIQKKKLNGYSIDIENLKIFNYDNILKYIKTGTISELKYNKENKK